MKYGYFDEQNKEYVITNPHTPTKWINYIGSLKFGGIVDHTGGSLICKGDPALNRIVKYIPQLPASDFKGETLYIRFKNSDGSYTLFSPLYVPTLDPYDRYECRVGLGYSTYITEFYGIRTEITVFVPKDESVAIRTISVTNLNTDDREIDIIPVVEFTHPDALMQFNNADWVPQTMKSVATHNEDGTVTLCQYPFMYEKIKVNFFSSNKPVSSFETDRKLFLGNNEYGTWKNPLALQQEELSNTEAVRGDVISALMHHMGTVSSGESVELITQLGQVSTAPEAIEYAKHFRDPTVIKKAFKAQSTFWEEYLSKFNTETPDADLNTMLNIHNPHQCFMTKNWSRYLSLYQLGLGLRGLGFRDSSQDVLGIIDRLPEEAKKLLTLLLQMQKQNGSAMHQFNPMTMVANNGDSRERDDRPDYYGDDHLWAIISVCSYIKETGDIDFLTHELPFYDKDKNNDPLEHATVIEHLRRGLEFTYNDRGPDGIPFLGFADWNDTVNLPTGAQSLMIANLFGVAAKEMIELCTFIGNESLSAEIKKMYADIKKSFNSVAWDGEWFTRYIDANGEHLGSHKNEKGKIYANAQSWAVLSGFAEGDKAIQALESINTHLNTSKGIKLSSPGYNGFDPDKGGITTYPPGAKENGGIFLHSNPWVMIAETMVGNGDRAHQYYAQINPATKNDCIDEFECEPYVYPQNILGDEHAQFGLARNSWLSGTSAWTYTAATKYILGIQPSYNGLIIDPCVPTSWDSFTVTRQFRGVTYNITFSNPHHVTKGVSEITVNGIALDTPCIPFSNDLLEVDVAVVMGPNVLEAPSIVVAETATL